jgi:thioredoxin 1
MKKNWSKLIVIILLILIVVIVIIKKSNQNKSITKNPAIKTNALSQDTTSVAPGAICETLPQEIKPALKTETAKMEQNVLALVNESKISKDYLNTRFQALPEQYKTEFKNDQEGFLDQMIIRELLYQEAEKKQFTKDLSNINDLEQKKDKAIEKLVTDISQNIQIPETEIKAFYDSNQSNMKGAKYEQVKSDIRQYLIQQKQGEVLSQHIESLKQNAKIVKNEQWILEQNAQKPTNPLDVSFKTNKPTVLDIGSATCTPCKMMKPIFEQLEKEYQGKANILLLQISEHPDIARKYQIQVIPTQIFFDTKGNEKSRHVGFFPKEEIVKKLNELGVK